MANDPYEEFRRAVACPDQKIELARAALTIAAGEYPNLLIAEYLSRIDLLAAEVAERIGQERNVYRSIAGLNHVLFQRHGYRGNRSEYFDPKNSFLNEVMERKSGIPITISVLYMDVAERIGLRLLAVCCAGPFLAIYV